MNIIYAGIEFEFDGHWEGGRDDGYYDSYTVHIGNADVTEVLSQETLRELENGATERYKDDL